MGVRVYRRHDVAVFGERCNDLGGADLNFCALELGRRSRCCVTVSGVALSSMRI